jgi:hypothetical protein
MCFGIFAIIMPFHARGEKHGTPKIMQPGMWLLFFY